LAEAGVETGTRVLHISEVKCGGVGDNLNM
jgi:hypothetical protein